MFMLQALTYTSFTIKVYFLFSQGNDFRAWLILLCHIAISLVYMFFFPKLEMISVLVLLATFRCSIELNSVSSLPSYFRSYART